MKPKTRLQRVIEETVDLTNDIDGTKATPSEEDIPEVDAEDMENKRNDIVSDDEEDDEDEEFVVNVDTIKDQIFAWVEESGKSIDEVKSMVMDAIAEFEEEEGEEDTAEKLKKMADEEAAEDETTPKDEDEEFVESYRRMVERRKARKLRALNEYKIRKLLLNKRRSFK